METIKIKYFTNNAGQKISPLQQIDIGNAIDLRSNTDIELKAGDFAMIPLGVGMKLPEGYHAEIYPRSSTFKKWGILLVNSIGLVDESFNGNEDQWMFPAYATKDTIIHHDDRIAQFQLVKNMPQVNFETVEKLDDVSRGGFGSTGTN